MPKILSLRRALATVLLAATAAAGLSFIEPTRPAQAAPEATEEQISSFTLAVLPDTQFYSRYATSEEGRQFQTRYGTEPFSAQNKWLVESQDELGIPFVTHLGDVVDQANKPQQWAVADSAMKVLEQGNLPYSVLAGNHDVLAPCEGSWCSELNRDLNAEPFPRTFSPSRAEAQPTFGGRDATGFHEYHVFERAGQEYLVLALSWQASDQGMAWAQSVIDAHPGLPTILTSHQILNIGADGVTATDTPFGERLWNRLIAKNSQIFLTLSGHHHGNANRIKLNDAGAPVLQIVNDYQMAFQGGNGYLGLYEFDFTNAQIHANQVSPWVRQKPAETITQFDQAVLTGANEQYSVPFDLTKRFTELDPGFTAPPADHTSYSQRAIDMLLENWTEPDSPDVTPPSGPEDYFKTSNTVAHWRFDGVDAGVFPVGGVVGDLTGSNPLTRAPLINGAEEADVTVSSEAHRLAPSQASMCFTNTDRRTDRLSYLSTAANAPLNGNRFENGYTFETFLKIDEDWTYDGHRWMTALASGGTRGGNVADRELAPFFAAISSLREVQWSANGIEGGAKTNWSGEIMPDQWIHVAAVNDPSTKTTTLYVEGAPVLRNTTNILGINAHANAPWMLGAGSEWGSPSAGWFGCIGETRLVEQPLSSDQWLTARAEAPSKQTGSASYSDDFERANGELGADWKITRGGWSVVDGTARNSAPSGLDNLAISTKQQLGDNYTVSSTLSVAQLNNPRQWVGVASNVHGEGTDNQGYYLLRFAPNEAADTGRWQFARVDDGHRLTGLAPIGTYNHKRNEPVVASLERKGQQLTATLRSTDGSVLMSETYTVPSKPGHTGGFAALYSNTGDTVAADFRIRTSADATVPGQPAAPKLAVDGRSVTVRWEAPEYDGGSPVTGYTVTLRNSQGELVQELAASATSALFEDLAAGDYTATISAGNSLGKSPASVPSGSVRVEAERPSAPSKAPELRMEGSELLVTWSPSENDGGAPVTEYIIELRSASGRTTQVTVSTDDPAFTDPASGFRIRNYSNGRFTVTVTAVNAAGSSEASPRSEATTIAPGLGKAPAKKR